MGDITNSEQFELLCAASARDYADGKPDDTARERECDRLQQLIEAGQGQLAYE